MTVPEGIAPDRVSAWFVGNIPATSPPLRFQLIAGGHSNLTYLVTDASGRRRVLRRPPTGHLLPTAHDMGREFRLISAVQPAGIPAPRPYGLCTDESVNGAPFYVMSYIEGLILRTPAQVTENLDLEARRKASESLVDTLAQLHALDPDEIGLGNLGRKGGFIGRQLKRWNGQYVACRDDFGGPRLSGVEEAFGILSSRVPQQATTSLIHGDYRLDNTMLDQNGSVLAVLDWELSTQGDPLADLGQLLTYWVEPDDERSPLEAAPTKAPGFYTRDEIAARYAEKSGRDISEVPFYVAFNYWKLACIMEGVYTRYVAGAMGDASVDLDAMRESLEWLGEHAQSEARDLASQLGKRPDWADHV